VFLLQGFCDITCGINSKGEEQKSDVIISIQGLVEIGNHFVKGETPN
jgi:hypothetical protein